MRKSITQSRSRVKAFMIIGLCLAVVTALFLWQFTMPDVSALRAANPTMTALMEARQLQAEAQGRPIGRQWMWVPLSRISPYLRQAVVAAEDASFFTHEGFDWEGIKDAALYDLEAGELKRGGSTITQQLAKNLYLSSERSLFRKVREALITASLEHHLTKKRILELYLNVAEWGKGVYGAEAAARHHFNKSCRDLTADEAAWLTALLPSPRRYDPIRKTTALARRHERILSRINRGSLHQNPQQHWEEPVLWLRRILRRVSDFKTLSLAEDCRLTEIMFKFEEIPGGIFKKERVVLEGSTRKPDAGLLIERQPLRLGLIQELLPRVFR